MKFLVGLILAISGVLVIRYRYQIRNFTGDWGWALKYLGSNGTITALALAGALLIAIGAAYPFGAFDNPNALPTQNSSSGSSR